MIFDPLDGSSNLDVGVGVGTIFSILRNDPSIPDAAATLCQPGSQQVAAGYVLYGSSTVFVLTTGNGVDMFVLDPSIGSFVLVKSHIQIPQAGKIYSVNEANRQDVPEGIQPLSRLGAHERLLEPLHRVVRRRRPSHAAQGRRVPVSTDEEEPRGQAAPDVRSESDRHDHGAGRRQAA